MTKDSSPPPFSRRAPLRSQFASDPDMLEIIELFVQEMPKRVEGMHSSWRSKDLESLRSMAHQLKGASGGYGFPTVGNAAAALELSLKAALAGNARVDLETIRKQLQELADLCGSITAR